MLNQKYTGKWPEPNLPESTVRSIRRMNRWWTGDAFPEIAETRRHSVTITDYAGRTVFRCGIEEGADWMRIPCSFAPGLYTVTARSAGMARTQRMVAF